METKKEINQIESALSALATYADTVGRETDALERRIATILVPPCDEKSADSGPLSTSQDTVIGNYVMRIVYQLYRVSQQLKTIRDRCELPDPVDGDSGR